MAESEKPLFFPNLEKPLIMPQVFTGSNAVPYVVTVKPNELGRAVHLTENELGMSNADLIGYTIYLTDRIEEGVPIEHLQLGISGMADYDPRSDRLALTIDLKRAVALTQQINYDAAKRRSREMYAPLLRSWGMKPADKFDPPLRLRILQNEIAASMLVQFANTAYEADSPAWPAELHEAIGMRAAYRALRKTLHVHKFGHWKDAVEVQNWHGHGTTNESPLTDSPTSLPQGGRPLVGV